MTLHNNMTICFTYTMKFKTIIHLTLTFYNRQRIAHRKQTEVSIHNNGNYM